MKNIYTLVGLIGALALGGCEASESIVQAQESEREEGSEAEQRHQEEQEQAQRQQQQQMGEEEVPRNLSAGELAAVLELTTTSEIGEARLARTRAENADVQEFAERVITDHVDAQERHNEIIQNQDITPERGEVTERMSRNAEERMNELRDEQGAAFDRAYMEAQVEGNRKTAQILEANLTNVEDEQYREFLDERHRAVRNLYQRAQAVQQQIQPRAER